MLRKTSSQFYSQNEIVLLRPIGEKKDWYRSGWVTASEAKVKFGITDWTMDQALKSRDVNKMSYRGGKRAPTLVLEDDLRRWLERFRRAIDVLGAAVLIRIPEFAVWELVESGLVSILVSEERTRTPRVGCLDTPSVMKLRDDILARAEIASAGLTDMEPLVDAILTCPSAIPPWSQVLQMVLSNELPVWRRDENPSSFISDLIIERGALFARSAKLDVNLPDFRETPRLIGFSRGCELLRISAGELNDLVNRRVLPVEKVPAGRMIVRRSLYEYALSRTAAS
jgi:hypothetical protein